ncbi:hypothetical protein CF149_21758 [Pseudomonas psychrophila]|nr:hypothetical protein CF149_21758 [Pseudomonas psychrophila]
MEIQCGSEPAREGLKSAFRKRARSHREVFILQGHFIVTIM